MSDDRYPQFTPLDPYPGAGETPPIDEPGRGALSRPVRIALVGAIGAAVLGAMLGLGMPKSFRGAPDTQTRRETPAPAAAVAQFSFRPIPGGYRAPDAEEIARASRDSRDLIAREGLSGAARASIDCYQRLGRQPGYALMDYCLALDVFGARAYERAAGDAAPPSTYFGQGAVRRQQAVQALTAGQTDANSRLIDTSRLIAAVTQAEVQPAQALQAVPPAPTPAPVEPLSRPAVVIPLPWTKPKPVETQAPPKPLARLEPRPAPAPVRPATAEPIRPPRSPAARPRPAFDAPSYDCGRARSRAERMVCEEPALAAADRRLANAFQRALDRSADPRRLIADQNRWLALREDLAPDYEAVMGLYQDRIAELRRRPDG